MGFLDVSDEREIFGPKSHTSADGRFGVLAVSEIVWPTFTNQPIRMPHRLTLDTPAGGRPTFSICHSTYVHTNQNNGCQTKQRFVGLEELQPKLADCFVRWAVQMDEVSWWCALLSCAFIYSHPTVALQFTRHLSGHQASKLISHNPTQKVKFS